MFVLACIFFNRANLNNNYFNGSNSVNGVDCASGLVSFSDPNNYSTRTCVASCQSGFYANNGVCYPNDSTLQAGYFANPEITRAWDYSGFKWTLFYAAVLAIAIGLLWMTFVHCCPRIAPIAAVVGAVICLLIIGILGFISNTGIFASGWKFWIAIIAIILAIIITVMGCVYANELKFQGLMLQYATRFLTENPNAFLFIPLYLLLLLGLLALFVFQHCAFSSRGVNNSNFFNWSNPGFWGVLNILEFIWALQFLRDSFNFNVSGMAVDWYWTGRTSCSNVYQRLLCRNWGSVVAGSFLNAFFEVPTLIAELFICHPGTCCSKLGTTCRNSCSCCSSLFNLVRTDAYSYINLSGIPYCNSARECEKLCGSSNQFIGEHSPMKHYRFVAHVFLVSLTLILAYFILKYRVLNIGWWHGVTLLVLIYAVITWFIDIHADAAEGIQTSVLAEQYAAGGYDYMQNCIPSYRKELEFFSRRKELDGNL